MVEDESLPQAEEFKYLGIWFTSDADGKLLREMKRRTVASSAVIRALFQCVVVERKLSQKAKLSIYWSIFVPTLTYGS